MSVIVITSDIAFIAYVIIFVCIVNKMLHRQNNLHVVLNEVKRMVRQI